MHVQYYGGWQKIGPVSISKIRANPDYPCHPCSYSEFCLGTLLNSGNTLINSSAMYFQYSCRWQKIESASISKIRANPDYPCHPCSYSQF